MAAPDGRYRHPRRILLPQCDGSKARKSGRESHDVRPARSLNLRAINQVQDWQDDGPAVPNPCLIFLPKVSDREG